MSSTVTVEAATGRDGYGKPTYGAATSYRAHVQGKRTLVRDALGQEVVSSQSVYLATGDPIQPTDRVTLSTADVGSTEGFALSPPILAVERRFDGNGPHHTVLRLR
jgi:hypothetical protein